MKILLTNNFNNFTIQKSQKYQNKNSHTNLIKNSAQADSFTKSQPAAQNNGFSFTGITRSLPHIKINSTEDFISQWEKLRFSTSYEALDDKIYRQNKYIRQGNFSFLENVPQKIKEEFIEHFKKFTGFPDFEAVTTKIENEYIRVVNSAASNISPGVKIVAAGYDPTCSVGMGKPFPGSDLDKAYVVLQNSSKMNSFEVINRCKTHLWFNTDQRILSLNNEDTFPEVYTMDGINYTLKKLDKLVRNLWLTNSLKQSLKELRSTELDPVKGGLFNIQIARHLPYEDISKEYAKNFAYFIESVRDGKTLIYDESLSRGLEDCLQSSPFARFSNVTQMGALKTFLENGEKQMKTKIVNRCTLSENFDKMNTDEQFELIKEIIKSVSKDNENPHFDKYFSNDDNIKERYDKLNRILLS